MRNDLILITTIFFSFLSLSRAQDIESKLSGNSEGQGFSVKNSSNEILLTVRGNGNMGIGSPTPLSRLHVIGKAIFESDDGFVIKGDAWYGSIPAIGNGTRMMFYPAKAALRAGYVEDDNWDDAKIGENSVAMGYNTLASGSESVAFGDNSKANGTNATAFGFSTTASGLCATAMGDGSTASGARAIAGGYQTTASGQNAVALGINTSAGGMNAFAMGENAEAPGKCAIAIGKGSRASGEYSFALGYYANTNSKSGAVILADASSTAKCNAVAHNAFRARFAGGYELFTNSAMTIGVALTASGNSWSTICDSTRKINYLRADGERVLKNFSRLRLGSWAYGDDPDPRNRHYGPMAQEWYDAFGIDGMGIIGCDTLLSSSDAIGIAYIAIQQLEARTGELRDVTDHLKRTTEEILGLRAEVSALRDKISRLELLYSNSSTGPSSSGAASAPQGTR